MGRPKMIDKDRLRAMWSEGLSGEVIAPAFGVTRQGVYSAAKNLGLKRRGRVVGDVLPELSVSAGTCLPEGVAARLAAPGGAKARARPEGWGEHHDARLIETRGRYGEIAKLSNEWWIAESVLKTRWLAIR